MRKKVKPAKSVVRGAQLTFVPKHAYRANPLLSLRMKRQEMELLEAFATRECMTVQTWARATLLRAARGAQ